MEGNEMEASGFDGTNWTKVTLEGGGVCVSLTLAGCSYDDGEECWRFGMGVLSMVVLYSRGGLVQGGPSGVGIESCSG
jgi:hypothetical protein